MQEVLDNGNYSILFDDGDKAEIKEADLKVVSDPQVQPSVSCLCCVFAHFPTYSHLSTQLIARTRKRSSLPVQNMRSIPAVRDIGAKLAGKQIVVVFMHLFSLLL